MKKSLIGLKGVLAIAVFFHHLNYGFVFGGTQAVAYFFVISGFLMALGYQGKFDNLKVSSYFRFMFKRLAKIYPLHLLTFLFSLVPIWLEGGFGNIQVGLIIKNLFLCTSWANIGPEVFGFNSLSWYLSTTFALYLITPIILFFIDRYGFYNKLSKLIIGFFVIMFAGFVIAYPINNMEAYSFGWWYIYISPYYRIFDYMAGIFLGYIYINISKNVDTAVSKPTIPNIVWDCSEIIIVLLTFFWIKSNFLQNISIRYDIFYLPFAAIFILVLCFQNGIISKVLSSRLFLHLGNVSFEIYIIHYILIRTAAQFLNVSPYGLPQDGRALIVQMSLFFVIILVSNVIHIYLGGLSSKICGWLKTDNSA